MPAFRRFYPSQARTPAITHGSGPVITGCSARLSQVIEGGAGVLALPFLSAQSLRGWGGRVWPFPSFRPGHRGWGPFPSGLRGWAARRYTKPSPTGLSARSIRGWGGHYMETGPSFLSARSSRVGRALTGPSLPFGPVFHGGAEWFWLLPFLYRPQSFQGGAGGSGPSLPFGPGFEGGAMVVLALPFLSVLRSQSPESFKWGGLVLALPFLSWRSSRVGRVFWPFPDFLSAHHRGWGGWFWPFPSFRPRLRGSGRVVLAHSWHGTEISHETAKARSPNRAQGGTFTPLRNGPGDVGLPDHVPSYSLSQQPITADSSVPTARGGRLCTSPSTTKCSTRTTFQSSMEISRLIPPPVPSLTQTFVFQGHLGFISAPTH